MEKRLFILHHVQEKSKPNVFVFRSEVEIWLYCACAMKNTQCNPYLMAESPKFL